MKKYFTIAAVSILCVLMTCSVSCTKKKKCTCTSGGVYEIVDSARFRAMMYHYPVPMTVFDTVLTQECFDLNYHDTTSFHFENYGLIMHPFMTCIEK